MATTGKEYDDMTKKASPPSPKIMDIIKAFLIGGLICMIGQVFMYLYTRANFSEDGVKAATTVTLIVLTAILTGIGVFDKIAKHAGAGTIVPITGFANSIVSPAMEFQADESDIIYPSQTSLHNFRGEYDLVQNNQRKETRVY